MGLNDAPALASIESLSFDAQIALRSASEGRLAQLPCTRIEADRIVETINQPDQVTKALDFGATQQWLRETNLANYRYVHFATHGTANTQNPIFSGLYLTRFDPQRHPVPQGDDFLGFNEIFNLKLNADVVVLSACETGLGENVRGEGLIGLVRGFMFAGSDRVVASLWRVNDGSTAELMSKFYGYMLDENDPLSPAQALRRAQLDMVDASDRPYEWAAFTIQGEWRP